MTCFDLLHKAIVIAFILIIAPTDFQGQSAEKELQDPESVAVKGLRFFAEVERELFRPTSTISVKLKLENTGKSPVYIHKQLGFGAGGFRLTILDDGNRRVPPNMLAETLPTPVLSKEDLQAINPGKSIEEKIDVRLLDYEITPGDYTLKIRYVSPVAIDAVPTGLIVLTSNDGPLEAKPIRFKVLVPAPE
jgi:hypothetical protein